MNDSHGGGRGGRKVSRVPLVDRKDREDEDLVLFKELDKRDKDRIASLLQPVSEEFEPNAAAGNYALYRIASRKKGSGYEFFGENDRNDYDWLKTPPATPLFPSLEVEAKGPELVVQREIPILQPLSRFSGNSATATKESTTARPKVPMRPITPTQQRKSISSTENKNTKTSIKTTAKSGKQSLHTDFITSNISKDVGLTETKTKATSRGVSPSVRSMIPAAQIYRFSNDLKAVTADQRSTSAARNRPAAGNLGLSTQINQFFDDPVPPNLRTTATNRSTSAARNRPATNPTPVPRTSATNNRPTSAARNRPAAVGISSSLSSQVNQLSNAPPPNLRTSTDRSTSAARGRSQNPSTHATHETQRKQSRSPSVTRGTIAEAKQEESNEGSGNGNERVRFQRGIVGSRMVEKLMNARKYSEERGITKPNAGGVGRNLMSKSSLDVALKQTEMKWDRTNSGHQGTVRRRSLTRSPE